MFRHTDAARGVGRRWHRRDQAGRGDAVDSASSFAHIAFESLSFESLSLVRVAVTAEGGLGSWNLSASA